ncbi:DUF2974 domain-containing protein [Bifidobacterium eulemuris]|uniref:DUF2974 domain-containing protein n=1 Tax=Bifidobacterium eulemuris TaxID=1765219 RepID=A0A261G3H0_9BIFI|nr:DUF2974 domain-containing protein [Bifidobacterium eulemuris]OZG65974.1 hypothetical protein BEUL_1872 [Bifidobacterium eulemuris]QOL32033.1 DUF2974 domain-containing protein [Bifidobacterium eulemuris]
MGNICDYVRDETRGFDELPFNAVDALVLAQLSYESIPPLVPRLIDEVECFGTFARRARRFSWRNPVQSIRSLAQAPFSPVTLEQVNTVLHGDVDDVCTHPVHLTGIADTKQVHEFVRATAANPRFSSLPMGAFAEQFDRREQTQFAAVTFRLPDGTLVLTFRGTDDSLVGWKEDFNMAFQYPVPAQEAAAEYLLVVAGMWKGPIILAGHSKGGNVAVYAAMNAPANIQSRITAVYSLDGPGFPRDVVQGDAYASIMGKIRKIVPDSSIIGMVLETPEPCTVVKSDVEGVMQHFAFSWQVEGDRFVEVDDMAASSHTFNESFNQWMTGLTPEERQHAVDALFQVLHASGSTTFSGLLSAMPLALPGMIGTIVGLTPDERKHIHEAVKMLVTAAMARNTAVTR